MYTKLRSENVATGSTITVCLSRALPICTHRVHTHVMNALAVYIGEWPTLTICNARFFLTTGVTAIWETRKPTQGISYAIEDGLFLTRYYYLCPFSSQHRFSSQLQNESFLLVMQGSPRLWCRRSDDGCLFFDLLRVYRSTRAFGIWKLVCKEFEWCSRELSFHFSEIRQEAKNTVICGIR